MADLLEEMIAAPQADQHVQGASELRRDDGLAILDSLFAVPDGMEEDACLQLIGAALQRLSEEVRDLDNRQTEQNTKLLELSSRVQVMSEEQHSHSSRLVEVGSLLGDIGPYGTSRPSSPTSVMSRTSSPSSRLREGLSGSNLAARFLAMEKNQRAVAKAAQRALQLAMVVGQEQRDYSAKLEQVCGKGEDLGSISAACARCRQEAVAAAERCTRAEQRMEIQAENFADFRERIEMRLQSQVQAAADHSGLIELRMAEQARAVTSFESVLSELSASVAEGFLSRGRLASAEDLTALESKVAQQAETLLQLQEKASFVAGEHSRLGRLAEDQVQKLTDLDDAVAELNAIVLEGTLNKQKGKLPVSLEDFEALSLNVSQQAISRKELQGKVEAALEQLKVLQGSLKDQANASALRQTSLEEKLHQKVLELVSLQEANINEQVKELVSLQEGRLKEQAQQLADLDESFTELSATVLTSSMTRTSGPRTPDPELAKLASVSSSQAEAAKQLQQQVASIQAELYAFKTSKDSASSASSAQEPEAEQDSGPHAAPGRRPVFESMVEGLQSTFETSLKLLEQKMNSTLAEVQRRLDDVPSLVEQKLSSQLGKVSRQLPEVLQKVERCSKEATECLTKVEAQEIRLDLLRTKVEMLPDRLAASLGTSVRLAEPEVSSVRSSAASEAGPTVRAWSPRAPQPDPLSETWRSTAGSVCGSVAESTAAPPDDGPASHWPNPEGPEAPSGNIRTPVRPPSPSKLTRPCAQPLLLSARSRLQLSSASSSALQVPEPSQGAAVGHANGEARMSQLDASLSSLNALLTSPRVEQGGGSAAPAAREAHVKPWERLLERLPTPGQPLKATPAAGQAHVPAVVPAHSAEASLRTPE